MNLSKYFVLSETEFRLLTSDLEYVYYQELDEEDREAYGTFENFLEAEIDAILDEDREIYGMLVFIEGKEYWVHSGADFVELKSYYDELIKRGHIQV